MSGESTAADHLRAASDSIDDAVVSLKNAEDAATDSETEAIASRMLDIATSLSGLMQELAINSEVREGDADE